MRRAILLAAILVAALAAASLLPMTHAQAIPTCDEPIPPPSCEEPPPPPPPPPGPPPCRLFADQPVDNWLPGQLDPNVITAVGGTTGQCDPDDTYTLRLRQDRPWWPDRTLAQDTSADGRLELTYVCDDDDEMMVFAETLSSSGDKVQSARLHTYCG